MDDYDYVDPEELLQRELEWRYERMQRDPRSVPGYSPSQDVYEHEESGKDRS